MPKCIKSQHIKQVFLFIQALLLIFLSAYTLNAEETTGVPGAEVTTDVKSAEKSTDAISTEIPNDTATSEKATDGTSAEKSTDVANSEKTTDVTSAEKPTDVANPEKSTDVTTTEKPTEIKSAEKPKDATSTEKITDVKTSEKSAGTTRTEKSTEIKSVEKPKDATSTEKTTGVTPSEKSTGTTSAKLATNTKNVYIIPVKGEVGPSMSAFIKRAVDEIPKSPDTSIIFEIDTFGGRVDSALQIVDTILTIQKSTTIAYVKTKAISAGALIALSCNKLYMKANTTIGDCAPISYSQEGPKMLGEKFQSPLRAQFRALAKKNEYDQNLAESMVSIDLEIFKIETKKGISYIDATEYADLTDEEKKTILSKKTIVKKGELLTMNDSEAIELGFSRKSTKSVQEVIEHSIGPSYKLITMERNWSEYFVSFMLALTPILMMIGLAAIYTEIKAPGFGAPGIVGIICLSLAFGSQYAVGLANYTELLLLLLGVVLIVLEVFVIPGFGIAGVSGFIFILIGMVLSLQDFTIPEPSFPWQSELLIKNMSIVFGSLLVSFIGALFILRYVLPKMKPLTDGPYLYSTLKDSHADSSETLKATVGDEGIAASYLRPSGKMKTDDNVFDVISEAEFIEKDTPIVISQIRGNQIIVRAKWK